MIVVLTKLTIMTLSWASNIRTSQKKLFRPFLVLHEWRFFPCISGMLVLSHFVERHLCPQAKVEPLAFLGVCFFSDMKNLAIFVKVEPLALLGFCFFMIWKTSLFLRRLSHVFLGIWHLAIFVFVLKTNAFAVGRCMQCFWCNYWCKHTCMEKP